MIIMIINFTDNCSINFLIHMIHNLSCANAFYSSRSILLRYCNEIHHANLMGITVIIIIVSIGYNVIPFSLFSTYMCEYNIKFVQFLVIIMNKSSAVLYGFA